MGLGNRIQETVASAPGTGNIALGGAEAGYTAVGDHYADDAEFEYWAEDGDDWEHGKATVAASGTSLQTRVPIETLVGGVYDDSSPTPIDLGANTIIFGPPTLEQIAQVASDASSDLDTHKASADHDSRYDADGSAAAVQANLETHKSSADHDDQYDAINSAANVQANLNTHKSSADHDDQYDALGAAAAVQGNLDTHKASGDHDGRYYTETEADSLLDAKLDHTDGTATNPKLDGYKEGGVNGGSIGGSGNLDIPLDGKEHAFTFTATRTLNLTGAPTPPECASIVVTILHSGAVTVNIPATWYTPNGEAIEVGTADGEITRLVIAQDPANRIHVSGGKVATP